MVQNWPSFHLFIEDNIGQENVFYDILKEKKAFLGYTTRRSKSRKFKIFAKWLGHCFGPKLAIFPSFYFRQYRQEKCVLRYFRTKKRLLGYKNKKFKKSKNWYFWKYFCPQLAIFPSFYFRQYRPRKCVLRCSKRRKRLS